MMLIQHQLLESIAHDFGNCSMTLGEAYAYLYGQSDEVIIEHLNSLTVFDSRTVLDFMTELWETITELGHDLTIQEVLDCHRAVSVDTCVSDCVDTGTGV